MRSPRRKATYWLALSFGVLMLLPIACTKLPAPDADEDKFALPHTVSQTPNTIPQSPDNALRSIRLPEGYRLELVASEPMISEPSALAWDGNGIMYVAQLETYMQTVDAKGQNEPRSSVMRLEDTDDDGKMDKSTVFIDSLLSPRMLLCVGRELLVNETGSYNICAYKDTDGDGKADQKRVVYQHPKAAYGNVEHQRSGLDWNIDNWIYVTTDPVRFKYQQGKLTVDTLISGSNGQWGLTHDNTGRLFFSRAASGIAAAGFQINPSYGQLDLANATDSAFAEVWPVIKTPDVNGGPRTLRPDSTLKNFTAVTGQSIFRGDRLPDSMAGDYVVCEPVGRFIRRCNVKDTDGKITLSNVYKEDEFISSTDMNFRPVNTYTGPDGCLYIVDMYRGIIQESTWAQPGSFLYDQIMSKGLNKNIKNGRIYRLVYEGMQRGPKPQMLDDAADKLVSYLDHPNGWWRDNAQKEIIVRGDRLLVPLLQKKAVGKDASASMVGRLHALWTLEGLGSLDKSTILAALNDADAQIRKAALRLSEPLLIQSDPEILAAMNSATKDPSRDVLSQLLLSLAQAKSPQAQSIIKNILDNKPGDELLFAIDASLKKTEEARKYGYQFMAMAEPARKSLIEGSAIFKSLCVACHGPEGQGLSTKIAPPLISKFKLIENRDEVIKIMLHGLKGPVDGLTYSDPMPPMGTNSDEWIASVLTYVRVDLCMRSFPRMDDGYMNWVTITPEQVNKIRIETGARKEPWTWKELRDQHKP